MSFDLLTTPKAKKTSSSARRKVHFSDEVQVIWIEDRHYWHGVRKAEKAEKRRAAARAKRAGSGSPGSPEAIKRKHLGEGSSKAADDHGRRRADSGEGSFDDDDDDEHGGGTGGYVGASGKHLTRGKVAQDGGGGADAYITDALSAKAAAGEHRGSPPMTKKTAGGAGESVDGDRSKPEAGKAGSDSEVADKVGTAAKGSKHPKGSKPGKGKGGGKAAKPIKAGKSSKIPTDGRGGGGGKATTALKPSTSSKKAGSMALGPASWVILLVWVFIAVYVMRGSTTPTAEHPVAGGAPSLGQQHQGVARTERGGGRRATGNAGSGSSSSAGSGGDSGGGGGGRSRFAWRDSEMATSVWKLIHNGDVNGLQDMLRKIPEAAHIRSADGRGPLWWAYEHRRFDMVNMLLQSGADATAVDAKGITPGKLENRQGRQGQQHEQAAASPGQHGGVAGIELSVTHEGKSFTVHVPDDVTARHAAEQTCKKLGVTDNACVRQIRQAVVAQRKAPRTAPVGAKPKQADPVPKKTKKKVKRRVLKKRGETAAKTGKKNTADGAAKKAKTALPKKTAAATPKRAATQKKNVPVPKPAQQKPVVKKKPVKQDVKSKNKNKNKNKNKKKTEKMTRRDKKTASPKKAAPLKKTIPPKKTQPPTQPKKQQAKKPTTQTNEPPSKKKTGKRKRKRKTRKPRKKKEN